MTIEAKEDGCTPSFSSSELEGRPRKAVSVLGIHSLAIAAAMALAGLPIVQSGSRREVVFWGDRREPINTGRREEKDAAAIAKAEAKRQRKAQKRLKNAPAND